MIRQATVADAKSVLPIINIVFEEMEMPLFQKIPLEDLFGILEQAFAMPEYRYSYANTLVYEEDGQVLGIVVGFPEEKEAHIDDALAPLFPQIGLPETTRFFTDKEAQPGEWHIDTIAVVPQARGKGVGSKLLAACESVAKANPIPWYNGSSDQLFWRGRRIVWVGEKAYWLNSINMSIERL